MRHLFAMTIVALLGAGLAHADEKPIRDQDSPEQLLSAGSQIYLRWDGIEAHKAANAKTALGKMLQGDTGVFVNGLFGQIQDGLGTLLTVDQLLGGVPPEKLQQLQADAAEAAKLLPLIGQTGFIVAADVRRLEPYEADYTLILPNVGDKSKPFTGALRLIVSLAKGKITEHKLGRRTISHLEPNEEMPLHLTWWLENGHAFLNLGTENPAALVKRLDDPKRKRLPENALFKRVTGFQQFPTAARAFVDASSLVKVAAGRGPEVAKLMEELGLNGLKSVVLYSGFSGDAERGLIEMEMPGPRKGLLGLFRGRPFTLGDVPSLPTDVVSWSMTSVDLAAFYDISLQTAEAVAAVLSPEFVPQVKAVSTLVNVALGLDLRKDLLVNLGDQIVGYTSPSEGPLTLGQVVMIKVKDAEKVKEAVEQIIKAAARLGGSDLMLKKRTYRGVEVRELRIKQQGFFFVPTYAVTKDWLCIALFPQPVHGFIARSKGDMPGWKPSPKVRALLDEMPREAVSISYSDPRPSIKQILSLGPTIGGLITSFNPETTFEIGTIPNAQDATQHLFPNVSVATADDKGVRLESRTSLPLPFDISGVDTYSFFFLFASVGRFAF
jgi:hypothetical protein